MFPCGRESETLNDNGQKLAGLGEGRAGKARNLARHQHAAVEHGALGCDGFRALHRAVSERGASGGRQAAAAGRAGRVVSRSDNQQNETKVRESAERARTGIQRSITATARVYASIIASRDSPSSCCSTHPSRSCSRRPGAVSAPAAGGGRRAAVGARAVRP